MISLTGFFFHDERRFKALGGDRFLYSIDFNDENSLINSPDYFIRSRVRRFQRFPQSVDVAENMRALIHAFENGGSWHSVMGRGNRLIFLMCSLKFAKNRWGCAGTVSVTKNSSGIRSSVPKSSSAGEAFESSLTHVRNPSRTVGSISG